MPEPSHNAQVLIVDDDPDVSSALADLLNFEGYTVACCRNGKDALDYLAHSPAPRVILLDLQMPVMDGWRFRAVQKNDHALRHIPVVVVSAFTDRVDLKIEADRILAKPIDLDTLLALIRFFTDDPNVR